MALAMISVKPSELPPIVRLVIRNREGFYYDGHGYGPTASSSGEVFPPVGESGVPNFNTKNILFAVKYGDVESIERLFKNHKIWCIERERPELADLFDKCDVLETYT